MAGRGAGLESTSVQRRTAPTTGVASFAIAWHDETAPVLAVYRGTSVESLVVQDSPQSVEVVKGRTYRVAIANWADQTGAAALTWVAPLANDNFANPTLMANAGFDTVRMEYAGEEPGEPGLDPSFDRTVWYRWTPTLSGRAFARKWPADEVDVFTGDSFETLVPIQTDLMSSELTVFDVQQGTEYRVRLRGGGSLSFIAWGVGQEWIPEDTEPPTVSVTAPSDGSVHQGLVHLAADASDDSGATQVVLWGNDVGTSVIRAPFETWMAGLDGPSIVKAVAVDPWGNSTESAPVSFTANNRPPSLRSGGIPRLSEQDRRRVIWEWEAATLDARATCSIDTGSFQPCASPLVIEGLSPGYHWFRVRLTDRFDTSSPYTTLLRVGATR